MKKEKYHLEYIFENTSHRSIWRSLSSEIGLEEWFADNVEVSGDEFTFYWKGSGEETAVRLDIEPENRVVYQWISDRDCGNNFFFEFNIYTMELTGEKVLEITDFATNEDRIDAIELWDMLIAKLRTAIGSH